MCPNARSSKSQKYGREASFLRLLLPYLGGQGDRIPWRKQAKTMPESATTNLKDFLLWKPTLKRNLHPSSMLIMEICSTSGVCWKQDREENHSVTVCTCTCVRECIHAGAPEQLCKLCIFSYCECPPWLFWPSFRGLRFQMQASVGFSVNVCTQEVLFTNCLVSLNSSLSVELEVLWTGLVLLVHEQDVLPCSILTKGTQSMKWLLKDTPLLSPAHHLPLLITSSCSPSPYHLLLTIYSYSLSPLLTLSPYSPPALTNHLFLLTISPCSLPPSAHHLPLLAISPC